MGSVKMKVVDSAAVRAQKIKTPVHKVKNTINMDIVAVMQLLWSLLDWGLGHFSFSSRASAWRRAAFRSCSWGQAGLNHLQVRSAEPI
jgi:hypothetical protein